MESPTLYYSSRLLQSYICNYSHLKMTKKSPWHIVALFAVCGMGTSLSVSAVMSCIVYYKFIFGNSFFVYINVAIFAPMLPMAILQAKWDTEFDILYGTITAFSFRGIISFVIGIVVTSCLPLVKSQIAFCCMCSLLGFVSAILVGTMNQLTSFTSSCGRNQAGFLFGSQASGLVVLALSFLSDFGRSQSSRGQVVYYLTVAAMTSLALLAFIYLICITKLGKSAAIRRDYQLSGSRNLESYLVEPQPDQSIRESLLKGDEEEDRVQNRASLKSYQTLFKKSRGCCWCIMVSVGSNIAMSAWFGQVASSITVLPQILFFTRVFMDALGRPASLLCSPSSIRTLAIVAGLRLVFVPIFFLVASDNKFPGYGNSNLLIILVAIIAFFSGYVTTSSYQLATRQLAPEEASSLTKQASLLNIAFALSAIIGVLFTLALQELKG